MVSVRELFLFLNEENRRQKKSFFTLSACSRSVSRLFRGHFAFENRRTGNFLSEFEA